MSEQTNPVLANVIRGTEIESVHRGSAIVVDANGKTVDSIGNAERLIYPRSALKLFQAISLVESGAADAFDLSQRELSLACASHNAEAVHVDAVHNWLARLDLGADDLECGPTLPLSEKAAYALISRGGKPTRAHQNCSGKHSGMLTLCRHMGWPTQGYSEYQHPSQQAWMQVMGEVLDLDIVSLPWERDGCGLPAVQMPMRNLALGFARFANIAQPDSARGLAMKRIRDAVQRYPQMIAGSDRCCTAVIKETAGKVVVKTGAEAVYGGCIPSLGIGFALKIDDGSSRGSEVALGALLERLGVIDDAARSQLGRWFVPQILNSQGKKTGQVEPAAIWS